VGSKASGFDTSRVRIPGTKIQGRRAIAVGVLALYILLFVILNNHKLQVNFVFFKVRTHELLGLIVIAALGFAAGFIVRGRRQAAPAKDALPPVPAAPGEDPAASPS